VSSSFHHDVFSLDLTYLLDAVHGDIKPSNILIHRGERGQVIARLGDFGYSTLGIETGICLPLSRGWNAPEVDDPRKEWTSSQARKADIFSLGLVCLWILTATGANASSTEADGTIWSLSVQALVRTGELTGYIKKLLLEQDITPEDQRGFVDFFLLALKIDPDERTDSISRLIEVFGNKRHLCVRQSLRHPTLGSANFDAPHQCTSINVCGQPSP
jgi:serine/threonine protein kinase